MSQPLISIIVPVYKVEKYLRQCIESIINQTLTDIEIILIDEGDLDECRKIIDEYEAKDKRIKTIHEKNGGYGASMNKGFAIASGEYIGIVEADDFVDKNMFLDLYKIAKENNADIVKSDFYNYNTVKNQSIKACNLIKVKTNKILNVKNNPSILRIVPSIWSAIYKREFLKKYNIKFLETKGGSYQDTSFAFKTLSLAEKIVFTPKAYLYYRTDNESSSVNNSEKVFPICDEYTEITNFVESHPDLKEYINTPKLLNQYFTYLWNLKRIKPEFREQFIDKFTDEFREFYNKNELTKDFYKKVDPKIINLLINDKKKFTDYIDRLIRKKLRHDKRKKLFSIRLNTSRLNVILFGKQLIAKDFSRWLCKL